MPATLTVAATVTSMPATLTVAATVTSMIATLTVAVNYTVTSMPTMLTVAAALTKAHTMKPGFAGSTHKTVPELCSTHAQHYRVNQLLIDSPVFEL